MSKTPQTSFSIFGDQAGNRREAATNGVLHLAANRVSTFTSAAAGAATLAGVTDYCWVLDGLQVVAASVVAGTLEGTTVVNVTVYNGTTAAWSGLLSGNGMLSLDAELAKVNICTATGESLSCRTGTVSPGAVSINLQAHKVKASEL